MANLKSKSAPIDMWKIFRTLFGSERSNLIACVAYSTTSSILFLLLPVSVQALVNSIAFQGALQPLVILSFIVFILLAGAFSLQGAQWIVVESIQRRIYVRASQLLKFPELKSGDASRFLELSVIQKTSAELLMDGLSIVLQIGAGALLLAVYHPILLGFGLAYALLLFFVIKVYFNLGRRSAEGESSAKYQVIDRLTAGTQSPEELEGDIHDYLNERKQHFTLWLRQTTLIYGLAILAGSLLLGTGGYLVMRGKLSLGELVAAEIVIGMMTISLLKLPKYLQSFYDLHASLLKLGTVFAGSAHKEREVRTALRKARINRTVSLPQLGRRALLVSLGLSLVLFLPWRQTTAGAGRVMAYDPSERPQQIQATVSGRVLHWKVREGDRIKKGELIVELEDLDPRAVERLESQRKALKVQMTASGVARDMAERNFQRQQTLEAEGISAIRTVEMARNDLARATQLEGDLSAKLAEIDTRISRQQSQDIRAPMDGFISRVFAGQGGSLVKQGDPLITFVPEANSRVVEIWVDGNDASLVHPGREVRIQFEGWPAVQVSGWPSVATGTFAGRVHMVDWMDDGSGKFRVLIQPEAGAPWPGVDLLRQGVRVLGWIQLEKVALGYEIWRRLNGFPPIRKDQPVASSDSNGAKK
jgi:biotin carboxyl carrier protein